MQLVVIVMMMVSRIIIIRVKICLSFFASRGFMIIIIMIKHLHLHPHQGESHLLCVSSQQEKEKSVSRRWFVGPPATQSWTLETLLYLCLTVLFCTAEYSTASRYWWWEYTTKHEVKGLLISSPQESSHLQKRKWLIKMLLDAVNCSSQARNTFDDVLSSRVKYYQV